MSLTQVRRPSLTKKYYSFTTQAPTYAEQEARLIALESQLQELLDWKQSILSAFKAPKVEKFKLITSPLARIPDVSETTSVDKVTPSTTAKAAPSVEKSVAVEDKQIKPVPVSTEPPIIPRKPSTEQTSKILDVLQRYGQHVKDENDKSAHSMWPGRAKFLPKVEQQVEACQAIKMILPSFPWKSVNAVDKVTGKLPDLGEELALARLNALCKDIAEVYEPGAEVTIATDGLVFSDLVGISDEDTYDYSAALMSMATQKGFNSIKLVRVMDLLGMSAGIDISKEKYVEMVPACRKELEKQFGDAEKDMRKVIKDDPDSLMTYRGFIRFLETDLKHTPLAKNAVSGTKFRKCVKETAMKFMCRAESFTKIIQATCTDFVRLSIHPSSGTAKLSIPLIPQASGCFPKSPWHSCIAVGVDGSYTTVHSMDVKDSHNLIQCHDRPYFYREKSKLYDWDDEVVEFEHLYPNGLLVRPKHGDEGPQELDDAQLEKLKGLAALQASVTIEGFSNRADGTVTITKP